MEMVYRQNNRFPTINISAGLILTLMATRDIATLFVNFIFAMITFKLSVDLESNTKQYVRPNRKS